MKYITIPKAINFSEMKDKNSLSASKYQTIFLKNKRVKKISDLLSEKPKRGKEVGSFAYTTKSRFYFIRTKALQSGYFLPILEDSEAIVPIRPNVFESLQLKKGDILLSKDANVGEVAFLNEELPNFMASGGLVRLRFNEDVKYYVFTFMKSDFFKNQILLKISRGATLKHAKTFWLDALIPFPDKNKEDIISFVSLLAKSVIRKEAETKKKFSECMKKIDSELNTQQNSGSKFNFAYPNLKDIRKTMRLDAGMFCKEFKEEEFIFDNYHYGSKDIEGFGFDFKRGQNLQVSQIGKSIYSDEFKSNFYKLIRPLNISDYGTVEKYEYLGNPQSLQTLDRGDIVFSAEGTIGKFCVFVDIDARTITNIHGITIFRKGEENDTESVFLGLFLAYLRSKGILDYLSVGGQGGSLGEKYWKYLKICNFQDDKKKEIVKYYHSPVSYDKNKLNLRNFENEDVIITSGSGILQLDKQIKQIKIKLEETMNSIIADKTASVDFDFLI